MSEKIKYWWSSDKQWFCILVDDGLNKATVSLTPEEAILLSINAASCTPAPADSSIGMTAGAINEGET